jgi:hypothetical protein
MKSIISILFQNVSALANPRYFLSEVLRVPILERGSDGSQKNVSLGSVAFERVPNSQEWIGKSTPMTVQNNIASARCRSFHARVSCPSAAT